MACRAWWCTTTKCRAQKSNSKHETRCSYSFYGTPVQYLAVGVWDDPRDKLGRGAWEHGDAVSGHGFGEGGAAPGKLFACEPRQELILAEEVWMGFMHGLPSHQAASNVACCTVAGTLGEAS